MRNLIDIMEGASWRNLWWFWYNPTSKQLVEVDGTHATTAHYDMGFEAGEIGEEGIELEDETAIKNAIEAGWVRGRYGNKQRQGFSPAEDWTDERPDPRSLDLSLQGQQDLVWQAAKDIAQRRRINDLYLDFGTTGEMESFHLTGKAKNIYLQTGEIGVSEKPRDPPVEWEEMLGHQLRKAMQANPDNFELALVKGTNFGDESHLTAWAGDLLVADAELKQSPSNPDEFWLMHIVVHPKFQGKGFSKILASWAFRTTHEKAKKTLVVSSFTDQGKERLEPLLRRIADDYDQHIDTHFNSDGPRRAVREGVAITETKHDGYQTWLTITDSYKGEHFGYCQAEVGDRPIGYVNFSIYNGRAHIKMIEVSEDWRRKGVATALIQELAREMGGSQNIDWGEHTEDGMAFHAAYDARSSTQP